VPFSAVTQSGFNLASHDLICAALAAPASTLNASYSFFSDDMIFSRQDISSCAASSSSDIDIAFSKRLERAFCTITIISSNVWSCCRMVPFSSVTQSDFNLASHDLLCAAVAALAFTLNASYSFFNDETIFSRQDISSCAASSSLDVDFAFSKRLERSFCIITIIASNIWSCCRGVPFSAVTQSGFNLASHDLICAALAAPASTLNASYSFFSDETIFSRQDISDWLVSSCRLHFAMLR